jgi:hypothetical protein
MSIKKYNFYPTSAKYFGFNIENIDNIDPYDLSDTFYYENNISEYLCIDLSRRDYIRTNLIDTVFPSLNGNDKDFLTRMLSHLINYICVKFCIITGDDHERLWHQLTQNNLRDTIALMQLLLPYIDDKNDRKQQLANLSDIYTAVDSNGDYIYTNSQCNRCIRTGDGTTYTIRPFRRTYLLHNLRLLYMTIDMCSSQLFVNWVDVTPMRMDNYMNTNLYIKTVEKINSNVISLIDEYIDFMPGLSISKIYNVIVNHLFHQIKNHKWIIYDINDGGDIITYAKYLEKRFDFEPLWNEIPWSKLTKSYQDTFYQKWIQMYISTKDNDIVVLCTIYFFMGKYHNVKQLIRDKLFIPMNLDKDNDIGDEDDDKNVRIKNNFLPSTKIINRMIEGFRNLPAEHIYNFFHLQTLAFKKTWYYYLHTNGKTYGEEFKVTGKIIYNYAKALSNHTINDKFTGVPRFWYSQTDNLKKFFIWKFYRVPDMDISVDNWFNINNYYRRLYPEILDLSSANNMVHDIVRSEIIGIVFESLICKGLLSEYIPRPSITDNIYTKNMSDVAKNEYKYSQMKKLVLSDELREKYGKYSYYHLTDKPYGELSPIYLEKYKGVPIDYFTYLVTDQYEWSFTYGVDWISQINFYHRFANTRVTYVTGSTGVGKSTQVPKLLLYAMKMIEYKENGKIICSVPRILPAEENAEIISAQSGVPIKQWNDHYKRYIASDNFQIQYKYQGGSHTNSSNNFLRLVTDGTLLEELKRSPFLTGSRDSNNKYDIVIVDEAHEHNTNMDMILTLMRDTTYINNSIRLIIISATMDADEPTYRRYYRSINDNRAYPPNYYIFKQLIDRANVDRRIHINPPGQTTQYKIKDVYLSEIESDKINKTNFVEEANKIANSVIQSSKAGNLLMIHPGERQIVNSVEYINNNSPPNLIALPYFSGLSDVHKKMVTMAAKNPGKLDITKEDVKAVFVEGKKYTNKTKGYDRIFIVGTNIMEASVTVPNLKFVVDTGLSNVMIYDPVTNTSKLTMMPISQSSADQRRGRVGRTSSGEVYHLYHIDLLRNIPASYGITNDNITKNIVDLMKKKAGDKIIVREKSDVNSIKRLNKIKRNVTNTKEGTYFVDNISNYYFNQSGVVKKIIIDNYMYVKNVRLAHMFHYYYGVDSHDDYVFQEKNPYAYLRCYTGYDKKALIDDKINFYIVHPDENIIRRNKHTGSMTGLRYSEAMSSEYCDTILKKNKIHADKNCVEMVNTMPPGGYKLPKTSLILNNAMLKMLIYKINNDIIQSPLLKNMSALQKDVESEYLEDINSLLWYMYGVRYNLQDDILALITLMNGSMDGFASIMAGPDRKNTVLKFIKQNAYYDSDIHFAWDIWMDIKKAMVELGILQENMIKGDITNNFKILTYKYLEKKEMNVTDYITIHNLYQRNMLSDDDAVREYVSSMMPTENVNTHLITRLGNIARKYMMKDEILNDFVKVYVKNKFNIDKQLWSAEYNRNNGFTDKDRDIIGWAKNLSLPSYRLDPTVELSDWQKVLECYIRSHSHNIAIFNGPTYLIVSNGMYVDLLRWSEITHIENTLLTGKSKYIVYHDRSRSDKSGVIYLTSVSIKKAMFLNPYYFFYLLFNKYKYNGNDYNELSGNFKHIIDTMRNMYDFNDLIIYINNLHIPEILDNVDDEIKKAGISLKN